MSESLKLKKLNDMIKDKCSRFKLSSYQQMPFILFIIINSLQMNGYSNDISFSLLTFSVLVSILNLNFAYHNLDFNDNKDKYHNIIFTIAVLSSVSYFSMASLDLEELIKYSFFIIVPTTYYIVMRKLGLIKEITKELETLNYELVEEKSRYVYNKILSRYGKLFED